MKAATNRTLRRVHLYLGVFFAPAIIFFAATGAVQTFRLNEAKWAPAWLAYSGSVHKNQAAPRPKRPKPQKAQVKEAPRADPALPLKVFVVVMSLGLAASALLGVAVALGTPTMRRATLAMLVLGSLVPVALLL